MKCVAKKPLSELDKEMLIREAEKRGPLSNQEKERIIREAENDKMVCHATKEDEQFIRKLLWALLFLAGMGLLYYLFRNTTVSHREPTPVVVQKEVATKPVVEENVTLKK